MRLLSVVLIASLFGTNLQAQSQEPDHGDSSKLRHLVDLIQTGRPDRILQAGLSQEVRLKPYLQSYLRHRKGQNPGTADAARLALAKLGDNEQLRFQLCNLRMRPETLTLSYLGGWFAIREALDMALRDQTYTDYPNFLKTLSTSRNLSLAPESPRAIALSVLPKLVPNPPLGEGQLAGDPMQAAWIWQRWIQAHEQELKQLKPTGEGVDFSQDACRKPPSVQQP